MRLPLWLKAIIPAGLTLLGAGASAETCRIEKKAELALGYANGLATVEAKINGTAVIMGLDTGAQTVVTPLVAEELKLRPGRYRMLTRGMTAVTVSGQAILRDFEFAGTHYGWKSVTKIMLPVPKMSDWNTKPVSGLIGMDVLANYDLDFDFPRRKLTLYSVKDCVAIPPPDFRDIRAIPFKFNAQRNIYFPIELDGKKLTALLDTGAVLHSLTLGGSKKAGLTEAALKADPRIEFTGAGAITVKNPVHKFGKLTIGGVEQSEVQFGVLGVSLSQVDALIGQFYLFTRRIRISNATRTLYVENKPAPYSYIIPLQANHLPPPQKPATLEDVCKGSAAVICGELSARQASITPASRKPPPQGPVKDFCRGSAAIFCKRMGVPAADLENPSRVPAAPAEPAPPADQVAAVPVTPAPAQFLRQAIIAPGPAPLAREQPSQTCNLHTGGGERLSGRVIRFLSRQEALAMIEFSQRRAHGTISPDYITQQRVVVESVSAEGRRATVLVPDNMRVEIGDGVEYISGHPASGLLCHYIPNLISRVAAPRAGR